VPGSAGRTGGPLFSPDGEWLAFGGDGKLKRVSKGGGAPVVIAGVPSCWSGATWSTTDDVIFAWDGFLQHVPAGGGTSPEVFIPPDANKGPYEPIMPELLPGDKALLFSASTSPRTNAAFMDDDQIMVRKLDTGEQRVLVQGGTSPHYVPTGHLLFARAGTIMAVPFDLKQLQVSGRPVALVEGLARSRSGLSQFSVSRNGTLAYISGAQQGEVRTLVWVDRKGGVQPIGAPPRAYALPQFSPNGLQLAVTVEIPKNDVGFTTSRGAR